MAIQQPEASPPESILKNIRIGLPVYCCTEEDATALRAQNLEDVRVSNTNGCDLIGYNEYAAVSTLIAECPLSNSMRTDLLLKKFQKDYLDFTKPHFIKYSEREVEINLRLRHDNIGYPEGVYVQLKDFEQENKTKKSAYLITGLVFEHYGTELRHYIKEKLEDGIIYTPTIVKIATQIASALQFMHGQVPPIIHRDVKPNNILVSEKNGPLRVKLIDYGHSRAAADLMTANLTEHYYTAPEIFVAEQEETNYETTVDIYSFGMVMYFVTVGKNPFERTNEQGRTTRIRDFGNYINIPNEDGNYPRPEFAVYAYPESLKRLIEDCWKHTPEERLRWDQINGILMELAARPE